MKYIRKKRKYEKQHTTESDECISNIIHATDLVLKCITNNNNNNHNDKNTNIYHGTYLVRAWFFLFLSHSIGMCVIFVTETLQCRGSNSQQKQQQQHVVFVALHTQMCLYANIFEPFFFPIFSIYSDIHLLHLINKVRICIGLLLCFF